MLLHSRLSILQDIEMENEGTWGMSHHFHKFVHKVSLKMYRVTLFYVVRMSVTACSLPQISKCVLSSCCKTPFTRRHLIKGGRLLLHLDLFQCLGAN